MQGSLAVQSLENFDPSKLTPLSPEVISRQATINIGTIGHVAHGKTTVVQALSGKDTRQHSKERVRNITIKLGYANCKIYQCPNCPPPQCYQSRNSSFPDQAPCNICQTPMVLQRHISFVDCPGHDILMATMLNGAAVMDACLLIIAGNEPCPQPQTSEHMAAVDIMQLKKILILQNKLDLVQANTAKDQEKEIKKFVEGTQAANAPIIPIVAVQKYNMDVLCQYICSFVDIPLRDFTSSPKLIIIRSFDVNKPGCTINDLKGGVAGGSLLHGVLKIGDEVEIRPGISDRNAQGQIQCTPILSKIVSLHAEDNDLKFAVPGGLIGVGLQIDPSITRNDNLVGHVLGHPGQLPDIYTEIQVTYYLLRRLLGVKSEQGRSSSTKVQKLKKSEILMVNVGSTTTGGKVMALKGDTQTKLELVNPVCCTVGEKVTLSRKVLNHWRLIGWGTIDKGVVLQIN